MSTNNLIPCPDCGNMVSRRANYCPKCGCPISEEKNNTYKRVNNNNVDKSFVGALKSFFANYVNFDDRTSVSGYWFMILWNCIVAFPLWFMTGIALGLRSLILLILFFILLIGYTFATIIPGIALTIRRLHDTNKSDWWYFITFVPYVGGIILLVFLCMPTEEHNNPYGPQVG